MSRIAYVNGRYLPHGYASVHIEDRGYQFADGVYEVIAVHQGSLVDEDLHLARLERSLGELSIDPPMTDGALRVVIGQVLRRNHIKNGMIYLQVTRGSAPRDHAFPTNPGTALVVTARTRRGAPAALMRDGCAVITVPDIRWKRCDIKSISLLPNVLAKQEARSKGAHEAIQVGDDGLITEGSASNIWIVTKDGELITRAADGAILDGVTRRTVMALAKKASLKCVERSFTVAEAQSAAEVFLTATSFNILPVNAIDDVAIKGVPGPFTLKLLATYDEYLGAGEPA
ncbi:MAG: D-amino-acid transaminase [Rhodospirillales bacterium]|jgi:D-alanine transaminase|nr:D-amino-acid transaminase [Rhodospirillales bacterium]MBT4006034.1 D-amino-acid transaminase [Rhodospirillales bacterium]MBT5076584.1 D-amino-acid transaminase [Rhodospirillales bacterium]MBT5112777.1 D-amino-acid transaminase [Rhodospirillales bacterium]MBT5673547.1 D-amino-acid transaminase [Rhodospirillales bacterium]